DAGAEHHRALRGPSISGAIRIMAVQNGPEARPGSGQASQSPADTRRRVESGLRRRYRKEQRFRMYGLASVALGVLFLLLLFVTIIGNGYSAFRETAVRLDVKFDEAVLDPDGGRDPEVLSLADYS